MKKRLNKVVKAMLLLVVAFGIMPSYAQSLKELAARKNKYVGVIMSNQFLNNYNHDGGRNNQVVRADFNALVLENGMKMDAMLPNRPSNPFNVQVSDINTRNIDRFVQYARNNNLRTRGHAMIWFSQAPGWLRNDARNWSAQQIYDFSRSYILALGTYCKGKIDEWDVLNEAIGTSFPHNYRTNTWYDNVDKQATNNGRRGYLAYFEMLFRWARQADPNAELFYNDFSIEEFNSDSRFKNAFMRQMAKQLKNAGAPIDGVGLQSHFTLGQVNDGFVNRVGQTMDDLGSAGLTVNVTEIDIRICNGGSNEAQRIAYEKFTNMAFNKPNLTTYMIWGIADKDSWVNSFFPGCVRPVLYNDNFQKKPAYFGVQQGLGGSGNGGGGDTGDISNGTYYIKKAGREIYVSATGANNPVNSVNNRQGRNTEWKITRLSGNRYEIRSEAYTQSRLEVPFGRPGTRQAIGISDYQGQAAHFEWVAEKVGNNFMLIPGHDLSVAMDLYEGSSMVHTWNKDRNNANQVLTLVPANGSRVADVSDLQHLGTIKVYPNPVNAEVRLHLGEPVEAITVYNVMGELSMEVQNQYATEEAIVDVSRLQPGIYFVKAGGQTARFIKQ